MDLPLCECGCGRLVKRAPKTITAKGIKKNDPLKFATKACAARYNGIHFGGTRAKGLEHQSWKGDKAGYSAIHTWLRNKYPKKEICVACKKKTKTHYASIGDESSREIEDYIELCSLCHRRMDNLIRDLSSSLRLKKLLERS